MSWKKSLSLSKTNIPLLSFFSCSDYTSSISFLHLILVTYCPISMSHTDWTNVWKRVCVSESCVSISLWHHSSSAEPVRGLCLTSLFNQTQTHTSGQHGPRYLFPASQCQMHTPCTLPSFSLSSSSFSSSSIPPWLSPPSLLQFSTPVHHIVSQLFIFLHFLCLAPCAPTPPPPSYPASLGSSLS